MAMDTIFIDDYEVQCIIGVYAWERKIEQKVLISIEVTADLSTSGKSDTLSDTTSYAEIADSAARIAKEGQFKLVEALAEAIAEDLLNNSSTASCTITINKPGAVRPSNRCGVQITRP